jgi:membrane fusion protein, copper/silver efflux system
MSSEAPMTRPGRLLVVAMLLATAIAAGFVGAWWQRRTPVPQEDRSAAATQYYCPMHPSYVSDRPGACPICGMRLKPHEAGSAVPEQPVGGAPKKVIYRSTMNPGETSETPGKDSMGMDMIPVDVGTDGTATGPGVEGQAVVSVPASRQQLIGVRTTVARTGPLVRSLRTVGRVTADETRLRHVHTKIAGWVEKLYVNATGIRVNKGDPLLSIYSPELLATQEEYLLALRAQRQAAGEASGDASGTGAALLEAARRRLLLFDVTPDQIEELERSGVAQRTVTLHSPLSGYVLKRDVTEGQRIEAETSLLDLADLSRVWVVASVYEYELPFVREGQTAAMSLSYLPGRTFAGRLSLVYPTLEGSTRTAQVRLEFDNPNLELKPEMFADVIIESDLGARLQVPASAIVASGERNLVFVARGDGRFEPRLVTVGLRLPESVEILSGVKEGEQVVTSGNFLIDSESKLKAALEAASAAGDAVNQGPR